MAETTWYAAKCIFQHDGLAEDDGATVYEERIVLLKAGDFDEAITLGEAEAETYAAMLDDVFYAGFISVYRLTDGEIGAGTEVYSLMRQSTLSIGEFLDRYHDDGTERRQSTDA